MVRRAVFLVFLAGCTQNVANICDNAVVGAALAAELQDAGCVFDHANDPGCNGNGSFVDVAVSCPRGVVPLDCIQSGFGSDLCCGATPDGGP